MKRTDMTMAGDGSQEYNAQAHEHIARHAERLNLTFAHAAEIYERGRREHYDALGDLPDPEPSDGRE